MSKTTTELEVIPTALSHINEGSISWGDLAKLLSKAPEKSPEPTKPVLPAVITPEQIDALMRLAEVFGKVVPNENRELTTQESEQLFEERVVLDQIEKMAKVRKDNIRTTILNHLDIANAKLADDNTPKDKDGHYLIPGSVVVGDKKFAWEVSDPDPSINVDKLRELIGEDDWLAMSKPVRVFDEDLAMEYIKDHPEMLEVVAQAAEPGKARGALNIRKA